MMSDWLLDAVEPCLLAFEMEVARERDAASFMGARVCEERGRGWRERCVQTRLAFVRDGRR